MLHYTSTIFSDPDPNTTLTLDLLFRQITTFIKVRVTFVFGLQTLSLKDFSKIYQLKGLKPKKQGQMNFEENLDLMKKYI